MRMKMEGFRKYAGAFVLILGVAMLAACSGSDTASAPAPIALSGKVVQGAVSGAKVWADYAAGVKGNRKMDAGDEAATATTTDASGNFTYAGVPAYEYISVSSGGTDSVTGKPAGQMLSPKGVTMISGLTTMVVLDPAMEAVISSLGVSYTTDVTKSITPGALMLLQTVQAVQTTLSAALDPGQNKMTEDQLNKIQMEVMKQVVAGVKTQTPAQITTAATLTTTLQTAVQAAVTNVMADTANSNITLAAGKTTTDVANAVVTSNLVSTVRTACADSSGNVGVTAADAKTEDTIITTAKATTINNTTTTTATTAAATVVVTAKPNQPPTISGTPTASVTVGTAYKFKPTAVDPEGESLTFSIVGKPSWATFNAATGELAGTAPATAITHTGIVISVTDRVNTVSLATFTISVTTVTGATGGTGGAGGGTTLP